jgi:predicted O-methyltransferase YrrM
MDTVAFTDRKILATLERLHGAAKRDLRVIVRSLPKGIAAVLSGRSFVEGLQPSLKEAYIPVSREQGRFLYQTARAISARTIVEFGTSFGISAIYLAAAVRDNGGGHFIGTEKEMNKVEGARRNLAEAGLAAVAEVKAGDALETLAPLSGPVDMVLLDGWKDLYLPVLRLLTPKLRPGAVVMADNIFTFKKGLKPYVDFVQASENGFLSMTLPLADGFEYSVFLGK